MIVAKLYSIIMVCAIFYIVFLVLGNKPIGMLIVIMGVLLCTRTIIKDYGPEIKRAAHKPPKQVEQVQKVLTFKEWLLSQLKEGELK